MLFLIAQPKMYFSSYCNFTQKILAHFAYAYTLTTFSVTHFCQTYVPNSLLLDAVCHMVVKNIDVDCRWTTLGTCKYRMAFYTFLGSQ